MFPAIPFSSPVRYLQYGGVPLVIMPTVQGDQKARYSGSRSLIASEPVLAVVWSGKCVGVTSPGLGRRRGSLGRGASAARGASHARPAPIRPHRGCRIHVPHALYRRDFVCLVEKTVEAEKWTADGSSSQSSNIARPSSNMIALLLFTSG